jgi:hypothetical protein
MNNEPSPTGPNGRQRNGRFAAGNKAAIGNPAAKKAQALRFALFRAVSSKDLTAIVKAMVERAKNGDTTAAKLLFDRLLGMPAQAIKISEPDNGLRCIAPTAYDRQRVEQFRKALRMVREQEEAEQKANGEAPKPAPYQPPYTH